MSSMLIPSLVIPSLVVNAGPEMGDRGSRQKCNHESEKGCSIGGGNRYSVGGVDRSKTQFKTEAEKQSYRSSKKKKRKLGAKQHRKVAKELMRRSRERKEKLFPGFKLCKGASTESKVVRFCNYKHSSAPTGVIVAETHGEAGIPHLNEVALRLTSTKANQVKGRKKPVIAFAEGIGLTGDEKTFFGAKFTEVSLDQESDLVHNVRFISILQEIYKQVGGPGTLPSDIVEASRVTNEFLEHMRATEPMKYLEMIPIIEQIDVHFSEYQSAVHKEVDDRNIRWNKAITDHLDNDPDLVFLVRCGFAHAVEDKLEKLIDGIDRDLQILVTLESLELALQKD